MFLSLEAVSVKHFFTRGASSLAISAFLMFSVACADQAVGGDNFHVTGKLIADAAESSAAGATLRLQTIAVFDEPWAMTLLDNDRLLVTTKPGKLFVVDRNGRSIEVTGVPKVAYGGQGGLGDVVLAPDFASSRRIFLSYAEAAKNSAKRGAVVVSAKLGLRGSPQLTELKKIWVQQPKVTGRGHYSHRMAFGPAGSEHAGKLLITSGDRQKKSPAQDWNKALGKLIRLNTDGSVPSDNPWQNHGELAKTFWSTGHRNMLGLDFDASGRLWMHEMGPRHGDELNLIERGKNYGWPIVSNGDNYSGIPIPDHDTRPEFEPPKTYWVPSIAPSGFTIYKGDLFTGWQSSGLIGGLVSKALIRVHLSDDVASEVERFEWGKRIRDVEQAADGALWVLEDKKGARLLRVTPQGN